MPFAHLERQVQPGEARVAVLEVLHNAERMQVVVELLTKAPHLPVEFFFAGMSERGMADVMDQGERLGEVLVQMQHGRDRARNLRHLECVRQSVAEVIG